MEVVNGQDAPRPRTREHAWRRQLESIIRQRVYYWVQSLDDTQVRVACKNIEDVLEVTRLMLAGDAEPGEQAEEKAS